MVNYTQLPSISDAMLTPFAQSGAHCEGKSVPYFEQHPPEQIPFDDVGHKWAAINQKPVSAHTIAQLRWVMCDSDNQLFRRAELDHNYYVRRDEDDLHTLGLVLGQITNTMHAAADENAIGVESLQNRLATIEQGVRESSDIRDWKPSRMILTGAMWAGGVAGSFVFLSVAFGVGVHKAPEIYDAIAKKVRSWFDKNGRGPKPPASPSGRAWTQADKGIAESDSAGTLLVGVLVFFAWECLPTLGEWEVPEVFAPDFAPAF